MSWSQEKRYVHFRDYLMLPVVADIPFGRGLQQKMEVRVTKECLQTSFGSDGTDEGNEKALFKNESAIVELAWARNVTNETSSVTITSEDFPEV